MIVLDCAKENTCQELADLWEEVSLKRLAGITVCVVEESEPKTALAGSGETWELEIRLAVGSTELTYLFANKAGILI